MNVCPVCIDVARNCTEKTETVINIIRQLIEIQYENENNKTTKYRTKTIFLEK